MRGRGGRGKATTRAGWGTQSEYAAHRGVSKQAVGKAVGRGRIRLVNGLVDFAAADAAWDANTDPARLRGRKPELEAPEVPGAAAAGASAPALGPRRNEILAARELYQMRLAKLEWEERSGVLVRADDVRAAAFRAGRAVRDALTSIPPRLGPILAATTDAAEVERLLAAELRRVAAGIGQEMKNGKPPR